MKIYMAWSGKRSKDLAYELGKLLGTILESIEPWQSLVDIAAGENWATEVKGRIQSSEYAIFCVTLENSRAGWMQFELGTVFNQLQEHKIIPYLFDLDTRDLVGPIRYFQVVKDTKEGTFRLLRQLNESLPRPRMENQLQKTFDALWPKFESRLSEIKQIHENHIEKPDQNEIQRELNRLAESTKELEETYSKAISLHNTKITVEKLFEDPAPVYLYNARRFGVGNENVEFYCEINPDGSAFVKRRITVDAFSTINLLNETFLMRGDTHGENTEALLPQVKDVSVIDSTRRMQMEYLFEPESRSTPIMISPSLKSGESAIYELSEVTQSRSFILPDHANDSFFDGYEIFAWSVSLPTKRLLLQATFPQGVNPGVCVAEVRRASSSNILNAPLSDIENERVDVPRVKINDQGNYTVSLSVDYPMAGLVYFIKWRYSST